MAVTTHCPSCKRLVKVPDELLGRKVRCPGCQSVFTAQSEEEILPTAPLDQDAESEEQPVRRAVREETEDDDEDDYQEEVPQPRRRRKSRRQAARDSVAGPAIALMVT